MKKIKTFNIINGIVLLLLAFICLFPFWHIFVLSFSSAEAANMGKVGLLPIDFTLDAYKYVMQRTEFWRATGVSVVRLVLGVTIQMFLTIIAAYPLSKTAKRFRFRMFFAWFFFFTMLFSGGIIPMYMLVRQLNLMNTIWALVLPGAVPVFNVIILMNFFRGLPSEIEEAAIIDGSGQFRILFTMWVPLAMPSLAALTLFCLVGHWNAWFDGLIYMDTPENYPLQSYLKTVVEKMDYTSVSMADWQALSSRSERTLKAAQIMVASVPILIFYPFLQKYFVKGITLGGVKG